MLLASCCASVRALHTRPQRRLRAAHVAARSGRGLRSIECECSLRRECGVPAVSLTVVPAAPSCPFSGWWLSSCPSRCSREQTRAGEQRSGGVRARTARAGGDARWAGGQWRVRRTSTGAADASCDRGGRGGGGARRIGTTQRDPRYSAAASVVSTALCSRPQHESL